jgi:signal transduction histidine kinase
LTLTSSGLRAALDELAARSPVAVRVVGPPRSFPLPIEAAAYFVCSEALANVAKYAHASQVRIEVAERDTRVYVTVADDGIGGADASRGSGLRGLVESPPGVGTNVSAEIPLAPDQG